MPVVTVSWWSGIPSAKRRELVERVTDTVADLAGCPHAAVTVIVQDVERDHWGSGGELVADPGAPEAPEVRT